MRTIALTFLSLVSVARFEAQAPSPTLGRCTYAVCSLRLEGADLVRGDGVVLGRTTLRGMPRLAPLVAEVDSALPYARVFDREYPRSRWLAVAAGSLLGVAVGIASQGVDPPDHGILLTLGATGTGTALLAWRSEGRAHRALSRALWWYNGALPPAR